jgi:CHAD domain-containing protein
MKKLKEFEEHLQSFVHLEKCSNKDIHTLRVVSRDLCSLLSVDDPFYGRVKKVIKISNKIRDMDVFFEFFLLSLPKKYLVKLDTDSIEKSTNESRKKKIDKLHEYLKSLVVPKNVLCKYEEDTFSLMDSNELILSKIELHKYRIYIKKVLVKEKNNALKDETKIKILNKIKDILGTINDNYHGLERLGSYEIDASLFKKIENYGQKENLKLFNRFTKLNRFLAKLRLLRRSFSQ